MSRTIFEGVNHLVASGISEGAQYDQMFKHKNQNPVIEVHPQNLTVGENEQPPYVLVLRFLWRPSWNPSKCPRGHGKVIPQRPKSHPIASVGD
jgi:hypothetical protein